MCFLADIYLLLLLILDLVTLSYRCSYRLSYVINIFRHCTYLTTSIRISDFKVIMNFEYVPIIM